MPLLNRVSHAFFLQLQEPTPPSTSHRPGRPRSRRLAEPELALLRFVETVTKHAYRTTDEDVQHLRDLGWTDPQIAECVYITALFAFFNRVADAFGLSDPGYFDNPRPPRPGEPAPEPDRP